MEFVEAKPSGGSDGLRQYALRRPAPHFTTRKWEGTVFGAFLTGFLWVEGLAGVGSHHERADDSGSLEVPMNHMRVRCSISVKGVHDLVQQVSGRWCRDDQERLIVPSECSSSTEKENLAPSLREAPDVFRFVYFATTAAMHSERGLTDVSVHFGTKGSGKVLCNTVPVSRFEELGPECVGFGRVCAGCEGSWAAQMRRSS